MPVPTKPEDFPQYFFHNYQLLAFISKDKMFKIEPRGSNTNPGVTIDHYITRKMVIEYYGRGERVTKKTFESRLRVLFDAYIEKVCQ